MLAHRCKAQAVTTYMYNCNVFAAPEKLLERKRKILKRLKYMYVYGLIDAAPEDGTIMLTKRDRTRQIARVRGRDTHIENIHIFFTEPVLRCRGEAHGARTYI